MCDSSNSQYRVDKQYKLHTKFNTCFLRSFVGESKDPSQGLPLLRYSLSSVSTVSTTRLSSRASQAQHIPAYYLCKPHLLTRTGPAFPPFLMLWQHRLMCMQVLGVLCFVNPIKCHGVYSREQEPLCTLEHALGKEG